MTVYAESSAVLAWLLGEAAGDTVREVLRKANIVLASDLTLLECRRVLLRALTLGEIHEAAAAERRAQLNVAAGHWHLWRISSKIVDRAGRPFPVEPIRTLDAIHLASALAARDVAPGVELLSLDDSIRRAGQQLGFPLQPQ